MEKNKNILKFNEILALGPSLSVLMEGYQDSQVTSLRGTLVHADTRLPTHPCSDDSGRINYSVSSETGTILHSPRRC